MTRKKRKIGMTCEETRRAIVDMQDPRDMPARVREGLMLHVQSCRDCTEFASHYLIAMAMEYGPPTEEQDREMSDLVAKDRDNLEMRN